MTRLSVIIPCYNCESYINECLDSVLEALSADDEVICIDDGSQDRTLGILHDVSDSRVKVIAQENTGPGGARNTGIEAATGDQILFVDADDVISPALIWLAKAQPEGSLTSRQLCMKMITDLEQLENGSQKQLEGLSPQKTMSSEEVKLSLLNAGYPFAKWIYQNKFEISGPVAKTYCREILMKHHVRFPKDLRWGEDICFNLQYMCHIEEVCFVPANVYWYRKVSDSLMNRYYPEKHLEIQRFLETAHAIINVEEESELEAFRLVAVKQYIYTLEFDFCNRYNPESFSSRRKKAWALKDENSFIKEGIEHCQTRHMSTSVRLITAIIRVGWFRAVDLTMKLYAALK